MENKKSKRYLLLISIHGLIRGDELQLGCDADTGGQTKYVVDLAQSLAQHEDVERVDLVTRRIADNSVSDDYARPVEVLSGKARIIRINAGPDEYIAKEQMWEYLDSFMDNLLVWLNEQPRMPDIVHSHYADAGYVAVRLTNLLNLPLIHTGHSLGRDKRARLLSSGITHNEIEESYNIKRRIEAEEEVLANANLVITSTHNEIEEQYSLYNYYNPDRMVVIPPGTDLQQFYPFDHNEQIAFAHQLPCFLNEPEKPMILALSRPDERKNILTLLELYGESEKLQQTANLLIIVGSREDIREMDDGPRNVITNILLLIDAYNLYGKVAIPKRHNSDEVPSIYRMVAASGGIFINPALTEPFGLTLLEAAASGLPVVATENGGPVDIIANCDNGELIDPLDKTAITKALLNLLKNPEIWLLASQNGIKGVHRYYTWQTHAESYMGTIDKLSTSSQLEIGPRIVPQSIHYRDHVIFSDLDQNLTGDKQALQEFSDMIRNNRKCVAFGIATGRRIDSALSVIKKLELPTPDILISSLGTRIHYGRSLNEDKHWKEHINHEWNLQRIRQVLDDLPGLVLQPKIQQGPLKISYYYDPRIAPSVDEINTLIRKKEITANVISSFGSYLDIMPSRSSKGQALRYVAHRYEIPMENILVAGGSGADEDMMRGNTLAVIVANRHQEELSQLMDQERIFYASQPHAAGIMEAIKHYQFDRSCSTWKQDNP